MSEYTAIKNIDQKLDIIDHVNQDHPEEVLAIARNNTKGNQKLISAKVLDIFEEGVSIEVTSEYATNQVMVFFQIEGELEDQILYLAYAAIVKEGRDFSGNGKNFFEVISTENITKNIMRIHVRSSSALPEYYPGYAYAFVLKKMQSVPQSPQKNKQGKSWHKQLFDRFFVYMMKHLSPKNREKLLQSANKDIRLYTLRKSWKSDPNNGIEDKGSIDVFIHGETSGGKWVKSLSEGDIIMSRSESADKHQHLTEGQALLIADETAYPALAGILEKWTNPLLPHVILISSKEEDRDYFDKDNVPLPENLTHRIICPPEKQSERVLEVIKTLGKIEKAWGACEAKSAKEVRHFLRNEYQLSGKDNHVKAYWKLNK
ncbi:siderophore-interacting protein [Marinomonas sp. C2222]|uniref:Siderophore-interacting protein n=1 Tax=Marinomonas sargassi TaxID=2984494 RepID=A0ABT2YPS8_9GAMM|nr:siderophore-interacting protein [Marinomonas sargassi]MCV2401851.1 siderophore-interacting protein [Marinomonas sargassi]